VIERLPKPLHAAVRKALRQAWEIDDADKAERLLRNLARRLEGEASGVAKSILEGLDEMLTVNRLGLPLELRRALACTRMRWTSGFFRTSRVHENLSQVCSLVRPRRQRSSVL
jgi:putative transposase